MCIYIWHTLCIDARIDIYAHIYMAHPIYRCALTAHCMLIYSHMYIHIHIYMYIYRYIYACIYVYTYVKICTYTSLLYMGVHSRQYKLLRLLLWHPLKGCGWQLYGAVFWMPLMMTDGVIRRRLSVWVCVCVCVWMGVCVCMCVCV